MYYLFIWLDLLYIQPDFFFIIHSKENQIPIFMHQMCVAIQGILKDNQYVEYII